MIFYHVINCQIFNNDDLVFLHQFGRFFFLEVLTSVCHLFVTHRHYTSFMATVEILRFAIEFMLLTVYIVRFCG